MPSLMETAGLVSLLRQTTEGHRKAKAGAGILKLFKLIPMFTSGCKMAALLGRPKALLADNAPTITLFGYRKGRVSLAIQEHPKASPIFMIELPILTHTLHKEMASGLVKIAMESETRVNGHHHKRKVMEENMWAVYCNGRKVGYSVRRKQASEDEQHVMQLLKGVSMGAGVLPCMHESEALLDGDQQLSYMRAKFERVVGSKDSEAFYMINPDGNGGPELSIFFVRIK
ncbi:Protein MIZU-KUSSEI 1-like plant protein [Dioscorea alata]|uniref:Protein MIZU-KUSSEI 1-like plant protein n=1 Tax=Dioscorea alata TaxID=55571 RepID=A0ACB7U569_DIOAL|nr:Protein MIZU-KUSSEI 1-like plant protein [Dioscorea alata]